MYKLVTKWFAKWASKYNISDKKLLKSIKDLECGLSTVKLGNGLYKVRVASENSGKSSAFRTIVVFRKYDRALIVYGFAKNEQDNLSKEDLKRLKILAKDFLNLLEDDLQLLIKQNEFIFIGDDDER